MLTNSTLFDRTLRKLIDEETQRLQEVLCSNNFTTVSEFRFVIGQITALKRMLDLIDEAYSLVMKHGS
jgi:hypothetical protein